MSTFSAGKQAGNAALPGIGRFFGPNFVLDTIPTSATVHQGYIHETGQMMFINNGNEFVVPSTITGGYALSAACSVLAAGLTECCAHAGRGKVFWFPRAHTSTWKTEKDWPMAYDALPDLYYVDYKWDERSKREWFRRHHLQRVKDLDARSSPLINGNVPAMAINLNYETDNYPTLRISHGSAPNFLYYNAFGYMYLGSLAEASAFMTYYMPPAAVSTSHFRHFWYAPKAGLQIFQIRAGRQAVDRLRALYELQRPGPVRPCNPSSQSPYKVPRGRINLGPSPIGNGLAVGQVSRRGDSQQRLERVPAPSMHPETGERLRQIHELADAWALPVKATYARYQIASLGGSMAVTVFLTTDDGFLAMSRDLKQLLLEKFELEQESNERGAALMAGRAGWV